MAPQKPAYEIQHSLASNENDRSEGIEGNLRIKNIFFALKVIRMMKFIS